MEDLIEQNKLFVGGISWETTEEDLREHFGKYGVVSACTVAREKFTGSSRGFAFVTFSESSAADLAIRDSHQILNKKVEVKKAIPRSEQQNRHHQDRDLCMNSIKTNGRGDNQFTRKKIFVGGLSSNLTQEEFTSYFERFGKITDVVVIHDNATHRPRGFGFITFDSEDSVGEVLKQNFHELTGKLVEVKRAVPKDLADSGINAYPNEMHVDERNLNLNPYPQGDCVPYGSRFGYFSGFGNIPLYPYAGGVYGGVGYGLPLIAPRSPWSHAWISVRGGLMPYGNVAPMYPTFIGLPSNGYNGVLSTGFD